MLAVDSVSVFYEDMQALSDVSFRVNEGEIVAIVGSNGAGKTTILRTISGLLRPKNGSINFLGQRVDRLETHSIVDAGIAHIPEGRGLFPYMTVMENLKLGAYSYVARKHMKKNLKWVFDLFPVLEERENQLAGTLSGGEQQMLAIGRGLMLRPKLLLLDEPSIGLMPKLVLKTFETVTEINKQGVTILLVEQNVRHALELANRGYVLESGRVVMEGLGKELLSEDLIKKTYLGI